MSKLIDICPWKDVKTDSLCHLLVNVFAAMNCPRSIFEEEEEEENTCIIAHPGFPACLNKYILQKPYYQKKQRYGEVIEDSSEYV